MIHKIANEFDIRAAVNHSAVGEECYRQVSKDGQHCYKASPGKMKKLSGYLRNVVLNKILLTNERWPFILHTPLQADLTIGIDVKHHTAGFTLVSKHGDLIRSLCSASRQKAKEINRGLTTRKWVIIISSIMRAIYARQAVRFLIREPHAPYTFGTLRGHYPLRNVLKMSIFSQR